MFDYRRGTSHGAPAIDAVLWQPRPRNTKSLGICIFKVTYDPLTEFHMCFFFAGFIYIYTYIYILNVCFIWYDHLFHHQSHHFFLLTMSGAFSAPSFTPLWRSASPWPWRIRIGTWAERHHLPSTDMAPWKNAWFEQDWFENQPKSSI